MFLAWIFIIGKCWSRCGVLDWPTRKYLLVEVDIVGSNGFCHLAKALWEVAEKKRLNIPIDIQINTDSKPFSPPFSVGVLCYVMYVFGVYHTGGPVSGLSDQRPAPY